jgi:polygalacturonase
MRNSRCSLAGFGSLAFLLLPLIALAAPKLPNINTNNIITITNAPFNAVGNGSTDNTLAISNAIFVAASGGPVGGLIGGTVRVPAPGVFMTGPLTFRNNVDIQVDAGAVLRMLPLNLWTNYPAQNQTYGNLLYAAGLTNLELSGLGAIDGQGLAWWTNATSVFNNRPYAIYFNSGCRQVLIQDITLSNTPAQLIVFKGKGGNITVSNLTELTPSSLLTNNASHNTDGIDLVGTNILVRDCNISVGDDDLALGTSSANTPTSDLLVTNCAFGDGHGVSIGSNTAGGVSNFTVINCTFNFTEYGIRMKSDDNTSGSGIGGVAMNLNYFNLTMSNIVRCPILIYSYYSEYGTPTNITPFMASTQTVDVTTIPVWRNITFSNVTASLGPSGGPAGMVWGRIEVPATNIVFNHVNLSGSRSFGVYNVYGIQFVDSQVTVPGGDAFAVFNAGLNLTNSTTGNGIETMDGLTSANTLALYSAQASMTAADAFGTTPITLNNATLTISNSLSLPGGSAVNFALGTNTARVAATGSLTLNSTLNLSGAGGFGPGNYTLFTYNGSLSGTPVLGATPPTSGHAWLYQLSTATPGQVNFVVANPPPPVINSVTLNSGTNLVVSGSGGTTNFSYYVLTSTNVALPLTQWTRIATNQFLSNGNFTFTNLISAGTPQKFYTLQYP